MRKQKQNPKDTKAYTVVFLTGYDNKRKPVYSEMVVRASNWNEGRLTSRSLATKFAYTFVSLRLNKLGGTGQLFPDQLAPQPAKIKKLSVHIGKPVVFDHYVNGKYAGTRWGVLESILESGQPMVRTHTGLFKPALKLITATTFKNSYGTTPTNPV